MLEAALDAIVAMDGDGRVVEWNAGAESIFGYARDEVIGELMGELIVPEELRAAHRQGLARYLHTGEPRVLGERLELPAVRRDGSRFPVELTITEVRLDGSPLFMGYLRDITDRKQAESLLHRRMAQQDAVATLSRQAVGSTDSASVTHSAAALGLEALAASQVRVYSMDNGSFTCRAQAGDANGEDLCHRVMERAIADGANRDEIVRLEDGAEERVVAVPVSTGEGVIGAIVACLPATLYGPSDVAFLEAMANVLATTTERNRVLAALQSSRDQLDVIFRNVAEAITVQDASGLVYANDAAARITGFSGADELLAAPIIDVLARFEMYDAKHRPLDFADLPGRRTLETGNSEEAIVVYRITQTGEERWSRVRSSPVRDETGAVVYAINIVRDITEEHREERDARFLARVGEALGSTLDYEATLQQVADLVVPELADWCSVDLVGDDRTFRSIAVAHSDPARVSLVRELRDQETFTVDDPVPLAQVVRSGEPMLLPEISDELLEQAIDDPNRLAAVRELGFRSSLIVPLAARGRTFGAIALAMAESHRKFVPADVSLLQEVARRAGIAVDNARLYAERDYIADTLQRSLLPPFLPEVPGISVTAAYEPARTGADVGGDFYDVFRFDERRWCAVVGDVQGKGIEAAALVGVARHSLRTAALTLSQPGEVLQLLNRALLNHATDRLCTAVLALVEVDDDGAHIEVSTAGHAPPVLRRAGGEATPLETRGTVLGVFESIDITTASARLSSGDSLILYSDGVAARGAALPETMVDCVAAIGDEEAPALLAAVKDGLTETHAHDDITLMVLRVT